YSAVWITALALQQMTDPSDPAQFDNAIRQVDWTTPMGQAVNFFADGQLNAGDWPMSYAKDGKWVVDSSCPLLYEDYYTP
ncbi:MAG: hypothetical protein KKC25_05780, partial [Proteobacteria bacterium]|nr:hypothetical protein [Pseudomonadota bacterium]